VRPMSAPAPERTTWNSLTADCGKFEFKFAPQQS